MIKSPGQHRKWKQATKTLVEEAERHVAKHGGKKRHRDENETSPSANYIPTGRKTHRTRLQKTNRERPGVIKGIRR